MVNLIRVPLLHRVELSWNSYTGMSALLMSLQVQVVNGLPSQREDTADGVINGLAPSKSYVHVSCPILPILLFQRCASPF